MFRYTRKYDKRKREDVVKDIITKYGMSYELVSRDIILDKPNWIGGVLLDYCPFVIYDSCVGFFFDDSEYRVPIDDVRLFVYCFKPQKDYKFNMNMCLLIAKAKRVPLDYNIMTHCDAAEVIEDGQAKISCSTLLSLTNAPQEVHILVIGSYSEGEGGKVSGKTYEVLQGFLVSMGYWGSMTCYDPHEIPRTLCHDTLLEGRKFHVEYRNRKFDYTKKVRGVNNSIITHVLDDAWVPLITRTAQKLEPYSGFILNLQEGRSKFAYSYVKHDGKTKILIKSGLENHTDLPNAIGGGYLAKANKAITISGTSNRVGHYHPEMLRVALRNYDVTINDNLLFGRANLDPNNDLFRHYSDRVISCKYFGETFPVDGVVFDQLYYTGLEKRFVYNLPPLKTTMFGCGCKKCIVYCAIISNFKVYNGTSKMAENMITSLICDSHYMVNRSMLNNVRTYIFTFAHAKSNIAQLVAKCKAKFTCSDSTIFRALSLAIRLDEVHIKSLDEYKDYSIYMRVNKQHRWYNVENEYIIYFDGHFIPSDMSTTLIYRPLAVKTGRIDAASTFFFKKYREIISYNSFTGEFGAGTNTFGDSPTYMLYITKDKENSIDIYNDWYLRFSDTVI